MSAAKSPNARRRISSLPTAATSTHRRSAPVACRGLRAKCSSPRSAAGHRSRAAVSSGCLPGITREVLLAEIRAPGIRVEEKTLLPGDLEAADEVFITSTTRDLLPVFQIEDKKIGRTDHTRQALARAFSEYVRNYVATHKEVAA